MNGTNARLALGSLIREIDDLTHGSRRNRAATNVEIGTDSKSATSDALDLLGAEFRNDHAPLTDSSGADAQRPRDIRGTLKVINNVLFEHAPSLTTLNSRTQPQLSPKGLTWVDMEKFATLADRLKDAMGEAINASDLARACNVSPAAVSKWLDGTTKKLSADNYASASRALGVREEWLRTGRLPRDREHAEEERQLDRVIEILEGLQEPLSALAGAIDQLRKSRPESARKRQRA